MTVRRILVERSDYLLRNIGDMAIMRCAVARLSALWPDARISVLTDEPDELRILCPQASPLASEGRRRWLSAGFVPGKSRAPMLAASLESAIRAHTPGLVKPMWARRLARSPAERSALDAFGSTVATADLVVVAGMGGLTDAFPDYAAELLDAMQLYVSGNRYVAMVGQGFGPLTHPALVERARRVLPKVKLFGLREERQSRPLLKSLGVSDERMVTTGDDALAPLRHDAAPAPGDALGVNLRASDYSKVDAGLAEKIGAILRSCAASLGAALRAIPISFVPGESDLDTLRGIGVPVEEWNDLPKPPPAEAVIAALRPCRLLVTGSYHGAVFALGSGIPVIGLARSPYYVDKFLGLTALYGDGCRTLHLDPPDGPDALGELVGVAWEAAPRQRQQILARSDELVAQGDAAYARMRAEAEAHGRA